MSGSDLTHFDDDELIGSGTPLPRIREALTLEGRLVLVTWTSGRRDVVDIAPALASRSIFLRLRTDDALFRSLRVSEYGNAIEWEDGAELTAEWIAKLGPAIFANTEFKSAMEKLGMSLDGMAAALQVSRRLVADYRKDKPIPRHIALATKYLVEHAGL